VVRLLDLASGRVVRTLHNDQRLNGASFNTDGTELVSGSPTGVTVWNTATGRPVGASMRPRGNVVYGVFDPTDPTRLYTVSDAGDVVRWDRRDPARPKPISAFRFQPQSERFSPPVFALDRAGRYFAVAPTNGDDSTTTVWDTQRDVLVHTFVGAPLGF